MIKSLLLVDDEELFHLVFEDACNILNIALSIESVNSSNEAEVMFRGWFEETNNRLRPECVFVDLNMKGSSFDGIELIRKINEEYGNNVVIGIISSSNDSEEIERAKEVGAMFWIVKTHDLEPRLESFKTDYDDYIDGNKTFTVYD